MKLKGYQDEEEQAVVAAPAASYCGSVPLVSDMRVTFRDTLDSHRADVVKEFIACKAETVTTDASFGAVSLTGVMQTWGLHGRCRWTLPGLPVTPEVEVTLQKAALLLLEPGRGTEFLEGFRALRRDFAQLEGSGAGLLCGPFGAGG